MPIFDNGQMGLMPGESYGMPDQGGFGGLLSPDRLNNPLLQIGLGILANNNSKNAAQVIGRGAMQGIGNYQQGQQLAQQRKLQEFQQKRYERDDKQAQQEEDFHNQFDIDHPELRGYSRLDPKGAFKLLNPKAAEPTDFGLIPQVGLDPKDNKQKFFIQGKDGQTKWLDAAVPPKPQFVNPTEYNPGYFVDPRNPTAPPVPIQTPQQPSMNGYAPEPVAPDPRAPWAKLQSPKQIDEAKQRAYQDATKQLEAVNQAVQEGSATQAQLARFMELNNNTGTGSIADRMPLVPSLSSDKREMEAIQAQLAPKVREPGSGTTSDRDIGLYLQGLPGVDKPGDVNKNIADSYKRSYQKAQEKQSFYNAYLQQYGHLNGAAEIFEKDYAQNHPIAKPANKPKNSTMSSGGWSAKKVN